MVKTFARHDNVVLTKLYAVHKGEPDAHVSISNELRDQLAHTLREDEAAMGAAEPSPAGTGPQPKA
jgi:hypothetical protein